MGLDVSHNAWGGAYSRFNRFRHTLAKAAGIKWPDDSSDGMIYFPGNYKDTNPGLYNFFCHSDCDGDIPVSLLPFLADELQALLPKIQMSDTEDCYQRAEQFIAGCRSAIEVGEPLEFG